MTDYLPLGTPVRFRRPLARITERHRDRDYTTFGQYGYRDYRRWIDGFNPTWRDGIVVGIRTLANGVREWGYESGNYFRPQEHVTAYLIAFDLHINPVYVDPKNVAERV